jgi:hypothetical protein
VVPLFPFWDKFEIASSEKYNAATRDKKLNGEESQAMWPVVVDEKLELAQQISLSSKRVTVWRLELICQLCQEFHFAAVIVNERLSSLCLDENGLWDFDTGQRYNSIPEQFTKEKTWFRVTIVSGNLLEESNTYWREFNRRIEAER